MNSLSRNHEVVVTAREFAETVELAEAAGFAPQVIGGHGGGKLSGKAGNLVQRGAGPGALGARPRSRSGGQSQFVFANPRGARVVAEDRDADGL